MRDEVSFPWLLPLPRNASSVRSTIHGCFCARPAGWETLGLSFEAVMKAGGPVPQPEGTPGIGGAKFTSVTRALSG